MLSNSLNVHCQRHLCAAVQEKHWRCPDCKRKMHSAAALQVHSSQVHKNNLSACVPTPSDLPDYRLPSPVQVAFMHQHTHACRVPFAKPGRGSFDIEVFGMAGIPAGMKRGVDGADAGERGPCLWPSQRRLILLPRLPS